MIDKSSGAALPGRPTKEPETPPAVLLPPVYHGVEKGVKLATQRETEQFLSQVWGEPASIVATHVGGHGPAYYARSEGHWLHLDFDANGWHMDLAQAQSDYRKEYPR